MQQIKEYYNNFVYGSGLPDPWFFNDDPFSPDFKKQEEYKVIATWGNNSVAYNINEFGFRKSNSLDSKLWFFGCSHTFGEALQLEYFAEIVANELQLPFYNFGTPSASVGLIARLLYKLRDQLVDKTIIIQIPSLTRFEIIDSGVFKSTFPHAADYKDRLPAKDINGFLDYTLLQNVMLIDSLTKNCNRHVFAFENHNYLERLSTIQIGHSVNNIVDLAADGNHYGSISHKNIANSILNKLK
jgi:hypothetical protein